MLHGGRTIRAHRGLPGSRAVVGGLLVAVAAVGTWAVASGATRPPGARYVVAARAVGPGERLEPDDLRWATLDLPPSLRARAFTSERTLRDAVALGPLEPGDLLQAGAVAPAAGAPGEREVSFAVDADWAVAGTLRPGDRIDVYATTDRSDGADSTRVLRDATIGRIGSSGGDGLGDDRSLVLTITVDRSDDAEALITAARTTALTVLRTTGTAPQDGADAGTGPSGAGAGPAGASAGADGSGG